MTSEYAEYDVPMITIKYITDGDKQISVGNQRFLRRRNFVASADVQQMYDDIAKFWFKKNWVLEGYINCQGIGEKTGKGNLVHVAKYMQYLEKYAGQKSYAITVLEESGGDIPKAEAVIQAENGGHNSKIEKLSRYMEKYADQVSFAKMVFHLAGGDVKLADELIQDSQVPLHKRMFGEKWEGVQYPSRGITELWDSVHETIKKREE